MLICRESRPCIVRFSSFSKKALKKSEFPYDTSRFLKHAEHISAIPISLMVNFCSILSRKLLGACVLMWRACLPFPSSWLGSVARVRLLLGQKLCLCLLYNPSKAPREHWNCSPCQCWGLTKRFLQRQQPALLFCEQKPCLLHSEARPFTQGSYILFIRRSSLNRWESYRVSPSSILLLP